MYVCTCIRLKKILSNGKNTITPQGHINLRFPIYGVFSEEILPYYEIKD